MIELKPEVLSAVSGFPITDSLIATAAVDCVIILMIVALNRSLAPVPGRLQNTMESVIEYFHEMAEPIAGKRTEAIFPWFASFFLFILVGNVLSLLPGVGTIQYIPHHGGHHIPLFRGATSDLNQTLALAAVSVVVTHILSVKYTGIKGYLARFFSINPVLLFVGLLELVSEATKLISLSFRLFGNMFAGEVVLTTVSGLVAFIAPVPFLVLESITALIQALVFSMLTMVFMSIMTTSHGGGEH